MIRLADDLELLRGFPPYAFNVYLMGGVVVDAGTRFAMRRILRQLRGRRVEAHALTHAHPDHQGASHAICETLGVPLWCGEADADAAETEGLVMSRMPPHWLTRAVGPHWTGPSHPVARRLREGDVVGGFTVLETPGHTAGHVSFWRESDRVLLLGDVVANLNIYLGIPTLREPERIFSLDPAANRRSARRMAALEPRLIAFGHGPPLRDPGRFADFTGRLPD
ncbi:MBL fold metallo-hydrolase [Paludisphaera mucosa]|uniref:MBL fold metallo-hydrolase n=1 Tax=Paludisphaera mucosa TaxID=3030827 RepID=A0ABT6F691_9BACT|nr:MBL fold metallo-hydrolase [Paludisphaera mucosa]MDG3003106.1 MBL fold metallo-hydrolase [Paludisphaera mucosa]